MKHRIIAIAVAAALLALAWLLPNLRHRLIADVTTWDAPPEEPAQLPLGEGPGLLHVASGKAWRVGEDGEHLVPENAVGNGCEEGGIDSAGVGHHQRSERAQAIFERVQLCGCCGWIECGRGHGRHRAIIPAG